MRNVVTTLLGIAALLTFQATASAQTITNQPQNLTVNYLSTASFTVGASGATSYQWQYNLSNINDGTNSDGVVITGSTNSTLMLEGVTSNNVGTYTVIINGTVQSDVRTLNVIPGTIVQFNLSGLLTNAPGSNIQVSLFDHDKPVTVQNFLHYINSGAYTNMFFDRCVTNFVLQGGDYGVTNRTNGTPPLDGWNIEEQFTFATNQPNPPYPSGIINEFGVGPLIHNRFGTVAMALGASTNSGSSAFFFNLDDNSGSPSFLDFQDFTVFGKVIDQTNAQNAGTNLLNYFNALTNGVGLVTNGVILLPPPALSNSVPNLPVNYVGNEEPANSNLVFCDFTFVAQLAPQTNPPTVAITSPAAPALLTNDLQGTASDDVGVADVMVVVTPQLTDGLYPYPFTNANPITNTATGATNWSVGLFPGSYTVSAQAQNGGGYLSTNATEDIFNTAVVINGGGIVDIYKGQSTASSNLITTNAVGYPFQGSVGYTIQARPNPGFVFLNWSATGFFSLATNVSLTMEQGIVATATFITNNPPKGSKGIAFVYPTSKQKLNTNSFTIKGKLTGGIKSGEITLQLASATTGVPVGNLLTATASDGAWEIPVTNLAPDIYIAQVVATNAQGLSATINEEFSVQEFKPVAGTYTGLVLCESTSITPTNSGYWTITVDSTGAFSGKMVFPAYPPLALHGVFSPGGSANFVVDGKSFDYTLFNLPKNPLQIYNVNLDITNGTGELQGNVVSEFDYWSSLITAYRSVTKLTSDTAPPTGKYVFRLNPAGWGNTNGYATLTVTAGGALNFAGGLPDGSTFSQSARISEGGIIPFFTVPSGYKTNGFLLGWQYWQTNGVGNGGNFDTIYGLTWDRQGVVPDVLVSTFGTNYTAPVAGSYSIVFNLGTNNTPVTNALTVAHAGGQFVPAANTDTDKLAISISGSGVISGHFTDAIASKPLQFKGSFLGGTNGGSGFILNQNEPAGYFQLQVQ